MTLIFILRINKGGLTYLILHVSLTLKLVVSDWHHGALLIMLKIKRRKEIISNQASLVPGKRNEKTEIKAKCISSRSLEKKRGWENCVVDFRQRALGIYIR